MPLVSFRDEYFHELEEFYKENIELSTDLQQLKSLDEFIEEITMYGLNEWRKAFVMWKSKQSCISKETQ